MDQQAFTILLQEISNLRSDITEARRGIADLQKDVNARFSPLESFAWKAKGALAVLTMAVTLGAGAVIKLALGP